MNYKIIYVVVCVFSLQAMNENDFCRLHINVAHQGQTECIETPFWVSKKEIENHLHYSSSWVSIDKQKEAVLQLMRIACPPSSLALVPDGFDQAMVLHMGSNDLSELYALGCYDHLGQAAQVQLFLDHIEKRDFSDQINLFFVVGLALNAVLKDPSIVDDIIYKREYELMKNQFTSIEPDKLHAKN